MAFSLKKYNTFGLDAYARHFMEIESEDIFPELIGNEGYKQSRKFIIGGGSNVFFENGHFDGTILHPVMKGIEIIDTEGDEVTVRCAAGENWKDFVDMTIARGWYGLENLSDIPGNVGAAPVQNVGAYGIEAKDCISKVYAINIENGEKKCFKKPECEFGYRTSIFKNAAMKNLLIYSVEFILKKNSTLRLDYGNIRSYLSEKNILNPTISDVAQAVKDIRASKLPQVGIVGSAGSFFKNAVVPKAKYGQLKDEYPEMPGFEGENGYVKIPTGWLIEKAGLKGYRDGDAGVWSKQALILVNHGTATGTDIKRVMQKVISEVEDKFGIKIEPEVVIV